MINILACHILTFLELSTSNYISSFFLPLLKLRKSKFSRNTVIFHGLGHKNTCSKIELEVDEKQD